MKDMFDEKLLDSMNFGELSEALDYVLGKIGKIEDEIGKGIDDPRIDMLFILANKIIMQMDAIIRASSNPKAIAQWDKTMAGYREGFKTYKDILQKEGTQPDSE
ncbi:MAG TPA: hypothetical protein VEQ40_09240 [Pyrinomonadaceae bacterium]|nr:hypothetical protein [Pyrinomonadaceae bacterium]